MTVSWERRALLGREERPSEGLPASPSAMDGIATASLGDLRMLLSFFGIFDNDPLTALSDGEFHEISYLVKATCAPNRKAA
ncbi:hypothetical protein [Paracoccus benzoatiresistens]|uniref:Uncharacterized protein n=1 Tax=Paracoccus benzoatiresistens TaxID=2997341 RepID=A0ABT4J616_9RHOB|nr:hypothetical protein [Paracoccus sp. EF6]MCZ0962522.1 hypothetical protein [Paracoccus sp. EF6]